MKLLSKLLIGLGCSIFIFFVLKSYSENYSLFSVTDYQVTGQFGDYIGGVVGTLFALAGTFLIYMTFNEQLKENKRNAFEAIFFQMINLHKENVSELRIRVSENLTIENREVAEKFFFEFIECYRDIRNFTKNYELDNCIQSRYKEKLQNITSKINNEINLFDLIMIDVAYLIVFYGLKTDGISVIRKNFSKKYHSHFYNRVLFYIELKPDHNNKEYTYLWLKVRNMNTKVLQSILEELYKKRKQNSNNILSPLANEFEKYLDYKKCYTGRQSYFGHYFRHLFQTFKFLNETIIDKNEKYKYGKMLRAQLSTFEQALLLINSLSSLGMKWEYDHENYESTKINPNLITEFQIIKNLPGEQMYGIKYKIFYPSVKFEATEF